MNKFALLLILKLGYTVINIIDKRKDFHYENWNGI